MRWLILYARSRQVSTSAAAVTLVALAVWALGQPLSSAGYVDSLFDGLRATTSASAWCTSTSIRSGAPRRRRTPGTGT